MATRVLPSWLPPGPSPWQPPHLHLAERTARAARLQQPAWLVRADDAGVILQKDTDTVVSCLSHTMQPHEMRTVRLEHCGE